jgi:hypothetical protein
MSNLNSKWYAGLRAELTKEVKLAVRIETRKGNAKWGTVAIKDRKRENRKSVIIPIFEMFASPDEKNGRSLAYHAEVAAEMVVRHELGMSLWANDGDVAADTDEDCVGVELNRSELDMMNKLIDAVQSTSLASQRK